MSKPISALIIGQPGPLCEGLRAVLRGIPPLETIHQVADISSALRILREHRPALVLLGTDLADNSVAGTLSTLRDEQIPFKCLILARDMYQKRKAEAAGAELVLLEGFPATKLRKMIEQLLSESTEPDGKHEAGHEKVGSGL